MKPAGLLFFSFMSVALAANAAPIQNRQAAAPTPIAPEAPPAEAPYDAHLARLSEILGALSYLRPLCGVNGETWRNDMQAILEAETGSEPARRARMTAAFNRGYRAFAATHSACTPSAQTLERRYRAEAATLVAEITSRFGN